VLADGRQSLLGAQRVGASDGRGDDVARGGVAVVGVLAAVGEGGLGRLPAVAERVLVGGQLIEQVVVDVDHADPGRGLGVDHADDAVSEIDVGAAQCAQLADAQAAEDQGRDDRAAQRISPTRSRPPPRSGTDLSPSAASTPRTTSPSIITAGKSVSSWPT
jgi:hypothetical protein